MIQIVGVAGRARLKVGKFGRHRLAGDQGAGCTQLAHNHSFRAGQAFRRQLRTAVGWKAINTQNILNPDQSAIERRSLHRCRVLRL